MLAFGGTISKTRAQYHVEPKDAVRKRIFIGPLNVMVTVDMGSIFSVTFTPGKGIVYVKLAQREGSPKVDRTVVWVEWTDGEEWELLGAWNFIDKAAAIEKGRGGWIVPLDHLVTLTFTNKLPLPLPGTV